MADRTRRSRWGTAALLAPGTAAIFSACVSWAAHATPTTAPVHHSPAGPVLTTGTSSDPAELRARADLTARAQQAARLRAELAALQARLAQARSAAAQARAGAVGSRGGSASSAGTQNGAPSAAPPAVAGIPAAAPPAPPPPPPPVQVVTGASGAKK